MGGSTTRIQLCGPLAVTIEGRSVPADQIPAGQCRLLFGYLVLNRLRPLSRDELAASVWGDSLPPAADTALSALLSKLRRALGKEMIDGRATLRLTLPPGAWIDVEAAVDASHAADSFLQRGAWSDAFGFARVAMHIAERELLAGESAEWLEERRRAFAELLATAYEQAATTSLQVGGSELAVAERLGRRLTKHAPFRESGYRIVMEALAARGEPAEGLLVYERFRALLRDELGTSPSAATQAVHAKLLQI